MLCVRKDPHYTSSVIGNPYNTHKSKKTSREQTKLHKDVKPSQKPVFSVKNGKKTTFVTKLTDYFTIILCD